MFDVTRLGKLLAPLAPAKAPQALQNTPVSKPVGDTLSLSAAARDAKPVGAFRPSDPSMRIFDSRDQNKDGFINPSETRKNADFVIDDRNGDGRLSPVEWLEGFARVGFEEADEDRNGKLTGDELKNIDHAYRDYADANNDGGVSRDEWRAYRNARQELGRNPDHDDNGWLQGDEVKPTAVPYATRRPDGKLEVNIESYLDTQVARFQTQREIERRIG